MSKQNQVWLRCKVDRGMFSDEVAVTYPATDKWLKSVFVPKNYVRSNESTDFGDVLVRVLVKDGRQFAVLPSSQRDIVRVEEADLHP